MVSPCKKQTLRRGADASRSRRKRGDVNNRHTMPEIKTTKRRRAGRREEGTEGGIQGGQNARGLSVLEERKKIDSFFFPLNYVE